MRVGFALPTIGPAAGPESVRRAAERAEALGYDGLWVADRLLHPVKPRTPYPASADGSLPEVYRVVLDPLESLTFAAAVTRRVTLGTSVLDIPFYNPVVLARRLTTLDVLSGGRLRVGLGLGWSEDEFEAVGASRAERGRRADEFLAVLKAVWTTDPVEYQGRYYRISRSVIGPKPVQKPHPPIYLAAYAPRALERAAVHADGWNPVGVPVAGMRQMMAQLRDIAKAAGRNPASLALIVRANVALTDRPLDADRAIFTGSRDQVKEDVDAVRGLGAAELFFDPTFSPDGTTVDRFLSSMERLRTLV
jgi:probable F420-dependent oxidoreductase